MKARQSVILGGVASAAAASVLAILDDPQAKLVLGGALVFAGIVLFAHAWSLSRR